MSEVLHQWYKTTFAAYQQRYPLERREWHAWCGAIRSPSLDLGCGMTKKPRTIGVDLAFGDARADALLLPFRNQSFATVIASHLIEHVDPYKLIEEVRRILKPPGCLLIEAPNLVGPSRALRTYHAGGRDARYPLGARTSWEAILRGVLAWRYCGRIVTRTPYLVEHFPGKDPDAVWWCNGWAIVALLHKYGFSVLRAEGWWSHTFRCEVTLA